MRQILQESAGFPPRCYQLRENKVLRHLVMCFGFMQGFTNSHLYETKIQLLVKLTRMATQIPTAKNQSACCNEHIFQFLINHCAEKEAKPEIDSYS